MVYIPMLSVAIYVFVGRLMRNTCLGHSWNDKCQPKTEVLGEKQVIQPVYESHI